MSIIEKFNRIGSSIPVDKFQTISLEDLNDRAAMLTRLDNKYVVTHDILWSILSQLSDSFDVLEIQGERRFLYRTTYFDDDQKNAFLQHHNGRRQRIKVRLRQYVSANFCYLEAKIKDIRGATVKRRQKIEVDDPLSVRRAAQIFESNMHSEFYDKNVYNELNEALSMEYFRTTLVAKQGGERFTIDQNIQFISSTGIYRVSDDVFIVETKSRNGNGLVDSVLRRFHQHSLNKCSKYCLGLCLTGSAPKINNFKPIIKKLPGVFLTKE